MGDGEQRSPLRVGVIATTSGAGADHGRAFLAGLRGVVERRDADGGVPVELEVADDRGEIGPAVAAAERLLASGVRVLVAAGSSPAAAEIAQHAERARAVLVVGAGVADELSGLGRHVFRAGRRLRQDAQAIATLLDGRPGSRVVVLARDSLLGEQLRSAATEVLEAAGHVVEAELVRTGSTDPAAAVGAVVERRPDVVLLGWEDRATRAAVATAIATSGLATAATVVTALGEPETYGDYDPVTPDLRFLAHHPPEASATPTARILTEEVASHDEVACGPAASQGWISGRLLQRAAAAESHELAPIVAALEGWAFDGPAGPCRVRAEDHTLLQPTYLVRLETVPGGEALVPRVLDGYDGARTAGWDVGPPPWAARGVQHVGLRVEDLDRAIRFYVDGLGGTLAFAPVPYGPPGAQAVFGGPPEIGFRFCLVTFGDSGVELFAFDDPSMAPESLMPTGLLPHFALQVGDTAAAFARLELRGAQRVWPEIGGFGRSAAWYVADPDGNVFELIDGSVGTVTAAGHELFPDQNPLRSPETGLR